MFFLVEPPTPFQGLPSYWSCQQDCKPTGISSVIKHDGTIVYISVSQNGFHKKVSGVPRDKNA